MNKKLFAWLVISAMLIGVQRVTILDAAEGGFTDIAGHWAQDYIEEFVESGALSGYSDGTFKPDSYSTRAETVTMFNKFFNIAGSGYAKFSDVKPNDWHYFQVGAAFEKGYIAGFPDGTFRPNQNVTHLQALIMLYKLLGSPEYSDVTNLSSFADYNQIPADNPLYRQVVAYMVSEGVINVYPDNTLRINNSVSRAELASLLHKVGKMMLDNAQITPAISTSPSPTDGA
ncbi:MAG: S-layer homology domain-containing protein, partial [Clostridiales bacterium]|nr:S-layer homology domain-containing protein [Clostridiales bacterium]